MKIQNFLNSGYPKINPMLCILLKLLYHRGIEN